MPDRSRSVPPPLCAALSLIRRRTPDDFEAEDVAQSVFLDAAQRLGDFKPGASPVLAWLYTVAQRGSRIGPGGSARQHASLRELEQMRFAPAETAYGADVAAALREAIAALPDATNRGRHEAAARADVRRDRRPGRGERCGVQDALRAGPRGAPRSVGRRSVSVGPDREVVELLRDDPDLLAIADAVVETQPPTRISYAWRLLAVAAVVGAVIVLAVVAPWHGHGKGLVGRALTAGVKARCCTQ